MPEPPGSSWPDQETVKVVEGVLAASGATLLVGRPASMVLTTCWVAMGALVSKTTDSWALSQICVDHIQYSKTKYLAFLAAKDCETDPTQPLES